MLPIRALRNGSFMRTDFPKGPTAVLLDGILPRFHDMTELFILRVTGGVHFPCQLRRSRFCQATRGLPPPSGTTPHNRSVLRTEASHFHLRSEVFTEAFVLKVRKQRVHGGCMCCLCVSLSVCRFGPRQMGASPCNYQPLCSAGPFAPPNRQGSSWGF